MWIKINNVVSAENILGQTDVNKEKVEGVHHVLNICVNNICYIELCKKNAEESFQNETMPSFNSIEELGK